MARTKRRARENKKGPTENKGFSGAPQRNRSSPNNKNGPKKAASLSSVFGSIPITSSSKSKKKGKKSSDGNKSKNNMEPAKGPKPKPKKKKKAHEKQPAKLKASKAVGPNHRSKFTAINKSNFLNHVKFDPRRTTRRDTNIPLQRTSLKKKEFRLHLPMDGLIHVREIPWFGRAPSDLRNCLEESFGTSSKVENKKLAHLNKNALVHLDKEMLDFCHYVRLTSTEQSARERFVQYITNVAGSMFGTNQKPLPKRRRPRLPQNDGLSVQIFGSFATPEICTFSSDIDLALWGIVPSSTHTHFDEKDHTKDGLLAAVSIDQTNDSSDRSTKEKRIQKWRDVVKDACDNDSDDDNANEEKNGHSSQKLLKEQRKQLWSDVLAESSPSGTASNNSNGNETKESTLLNEKSTATNALQTSDTMCTVNKDKTSNAKQIPTSSDKTNITDPNNSCLFVIDREGIDSTDGKTSTISEKHDPKEKQLIADKKDAKEEEESSSNQQKDQPSISERSETKEVSDTHSAQQAKPGSSKASAVVVDTDDGSSKEVLDLCSDSGNGSDSDDDTADKLESYHNRSNKAVAQISDKRRKLSSCDSTSTSDSEDDAYMRHFADRHFDDTGMDVSFVNREAAGAPPPSSNGPTGETKRLVVKALSSLGRSLRQDSLSLNVEVRSRARVPIINMTTKLGFEGDIAIGGHIGTDTSQYAATQVQRFASFAPVVLVLKIILNQQGLDKPFIGGLGSYKLYVLVAHHLERHLSAGGSDRPSEVLLAFFQRYGEYGSPPHHTMLGTHVTVRSEGGTADLQPVFHVDSCVELFQQCWEIFKKYEGTFHSADKSYLGCLINARRLQHDRKECLKRANNHLLPSLSSKNSDITRDHPGKVSAGRKVNYVFTRDGNSDAPQKDADVDGLPIGRMAQPARRSPRGDLIPKSRPDVEARQQEKTANPNGDAPQNYADVDGLPIGRMAQPVRRSPRGALIPKSRPDIEARQQEKTVNPNGELYGRALKNKNRRNKTKQKRDKARREFAADGIAIGRMAQPVRRSPRAALIPKSRPDVEARQQEKTANPNGDAPKTTPM